MNAEGWAKVEDIFFKGADAVTMYLVLKTSPWDVPPLTLAGIAHQDVLQARTHCRKWKAEFQLVPLDAAVKTQHGLTLQCFRPQSPVCDM